MGEGEERGHLLVLQKIIQEASKAMANTANDGDQKLELFVSYFDTVLCKPKCHFMVKMMLVLAFHGHLCMILVYYAIDTKRAVYLKPSFDVPLRDGTLQASKEKEPHIIAIHGQTIQYTFQESSTYISVQFQGIILHVHYCRLLFFYLLSLFLLRASQSRSL